MDFPVINNNLCNDYINYLKEYNKPKIYENIFLDIKRNDTKITNFITLEKNKNHKKLNFFGLPFALQNEKSNISDLINLVKEIKKISLDKKIDEVDLILFKEISSLKYLDELDKKNISKIVIQKFIDLNIDIKFIKNQFSKGHKHLINRKFLELNYKIIDYKNYNNEIFDMMKLHKYVSGRSTRSRDTWVLNEQMIVNKKGFLISVSLGKEIISYSFFYCYNNYSEYFSSCTKRDYFKKFNNINHKSIYLAIEYLKKRKFKYFTMGETKNLYSENPFSVKEKNIHKFKSSFGGKSLLKIYFKNIDDNIINIYEED